MSDGPSADYGRDGLERALREIVHLTHNGKDWQGRQVNKIAFSALANYIGKQSVMTSVVEE